MNLEIICSVSENSAGDIAILIDASGSATPHFRREIADTLQLISQTAGVPDEHLSLFSFHDLQPALLCAGDCRASGATERLPAARAGGLTPLFDTIVFAADFLAHHSDARAEKVLVVFSDGMDTVSRNSLADAVEKSLKTDVQVDCIDLNKHSSLSQGATVLRSLSNATGGSYFAAPNGADHALKVILDGFQASYTITYRLPSRSVGFHAVRILPTHDLNLKFRNRGGYYYPDQIQ